MFRKSSVIALALILCVCAMWGCSKKKSPTAATPAPAAPALSSPADYAVVSSLSPTLAWRPSAGAASYALQVSVSNSFSSFVFNQSGLTGTSQIVPGLDSMVSLYYWRVNATGANGTSNWSAVWKFVPTMHGPPPAPELATPVDKAINLTGDMIEFTWSAIIRGTSSSDTTKYALQVSTDALFGSFVKDTSGLTNLSLGLTSFGVVSAYYWRVNARNNYGPSGWSSIRKFTTGPKEVGFDTLPKGLSYSVAVSGNYAYVAKERNGLRITNISNPASPSPSVNLAYDTSGRAYCVVVSGNYAYMANGPTGLRVVNVSNPSNPIAAGSYNTPGTAECVAVVDSFAYVADGSSGLRIINVTNPAAPVLAGYYDTPGYARSVAVSGNYAYVADGTEGLRIINISNPASPSLAGHYQTPQYAYGVTVSGSYAYVATATGLRIVNISNPAGPSETGHIDTKEMAYGVAISGAFAYVAGYGSGLRIIDISSPAGPSEIGYFDTPGLALGVAVSGNYAYVADYIKGLRIIKIAP
ncbi:MAG: hypothetical protein QME74_03755 [Candidatus Edwardsbacteria bacterium]|nr:hypothetical protein [Candidatus Edwardsbacteria bacterium]